MSDQVNNPPHYTNAAGKIEPIDFCRVFPFCFGNFCKYVIRAPFKGNEAQDLRKAAKYLEWSKGELYRITKTLNAYSHLAKCFDNRWLNMVFTDHNYAYNFDLTVKCLLAYADALEQTDEGRENI